MYAFWYTRIIDQPCYWMNLFWSTFKLFDDNGDKKLSFEDFMKGMRDYQTGVTPEVSIGTDYVLTF